MYCKRRQFLKSPVLHHRLIFSGHPYIQGGILARQRCPVRSVKKVLCHSSSLCEVNIALQQVGEIQQTLFLPWQLH